MNRQRCAAFLLVMILLLFCRAAYADVANTSWPMFRQNTYHTARSTIPASGSVGILKWKYQTDNAVCSSPVIGPGGIIYVGSLDGYIYAVRPDGTLQWRFFAGGYIYSSPAVGDDGTIYVGSLNGNLYAINPDGTEQWRHTAGSAFYTSPVIAPDGTVYAGGDDHNLYAFYSTGTVAWSYLTGGTVYSSPALGSDGTVYVGSFDNSVYAINPDHSLEWSCATTGSIYSSPAIGSDGTIYVGSDDWNVYAFCSTGTIKWQYTTGYDVYSSPAIGADGTVYVGSDDGYLYALDPADGTRKWRYQTGGRIRLLSPAVGSDGIIYAASEDNTVYALNPDGTLRWQYALGGEGNWQSSPAIGADGTLYIGCTDYCLYAIVVTTPPVLSWTGEANFVDDGINPAMDYAGNPFTFRVRYTDDNGDAPAAGYPKVHVRKNGAEISGSPFSMNHISGTAAAGALYACPVTLNAPGADYTYYFEAYDVWGATATGQPVSSLSAPCVIALTTIAPPGAFNSSPVVALSITAEGFPGGSTVRLVKSGSSDIAGTGTVIVSTGITCRVDLTGAATGYWDVVLSSGGSGAASLTVSNAFLFSSMTITAITPYAAYNSGPVSITSLNGNGFVAGSTVRLSRDGSSDREATAVVVEATRLTGTVDLAGAATGYWDVIVTTGGPAAVSARLNSGFYVSSMTVHAVTPYNGCNTEPLIITAVRGAGFVSGAAVTITRAGESDIVATGVTFIDTTRISCVVDITGAATGYWDVKVSTGGPAAFAVSLSSGLFVNIIGVKTVAPASWYNTGEEYRATITGAGFSNGTTLVFSKSGCSNLLPVRSSVDSPTQITAVFDLAGVATGYWDLTASTGGAGSFYATCNDALLALPLNIASVTPPVLYVTGVPATLEVAGGGFVSGTTVRLDNAQGEYLSPTNLAVTPARITCTLAVAHATTGYWNVTVSTGNAGALSATQADGLLIAPCGIAGLSDAKAYPIPYDPAAGSMTFEKLTDDAVIRIYTVRGQLVKTIDGPVVNGMAAWDGRNEAGTVVASGIYLVLVQNAQETRKLKIAVEK